MSTALQSQSSSFPTPVRRVNILPASGKNPAFITVYFRDIKSAKAGYTKLLSGLAGDPRTKLDLSKPMPTLTYPVI